MQLKGISFIGFFSVLMEVRYLEADLAHTVMGRRTKRGEEHEKVFNNRSKFFNVIVV